MKKAFLILTFISTYLIAQTPKELGKEMKGVKSDVNEIKTILNNLQRQINEVVTQNNYLKKNLEINNPVLEQEAENTNFKIIKVVGNKKEKSITISILLETKDKFKKFSMEDFSIIDLEGNEIKTYPKYEESHGELEPKTPRKSNITFKYDNIENDFPKLVKLLKFNFIYRCDGENAFQNKKLKIKFTDLNITLKQ